MFQIHQGEDDLGKTDVPGSNSTGNAGARMGCCLIEKVCAFFKI